MTITIEDFVQREVIYCVSTLIWDLTQKDCDCLSEEDKHELWTGPVDYEAAKYELEHDDDRTFQMVCPDDGQVYWGVKNLHGTFKVDPIHNDEETAIYEWFEIYHGGDLEEYRQEIFEHWIVTSYFAKKLAEEGETVVELLGLTIWARATTGQSIALDHVIQTIYNEMISTTRLDMLGLPQHPSRSK